MISRLSGKYWLLFVLNSELIEKLDQKRKQASNVLGMKLDEKVIQTGIKSSGRIFTNKIEMKPIKAYDSYNYAKAEVYFRFF